MAKRMEADSIGVLEVPVDVYYGVQAERAQRNFQITGHQMNPAFIRNLALIKEAAALVNHEAGLLTADRTNAIVKACREVIDGGLQDSFIVDPIQGGAGTSANMNMNEVIANRANEILGGKKVLMTACIRTITSTWRSPRMTRFQRLASSRSSR